MSALSNMLIPVFGSERKGAVDLPAKLASCCRRGEPLPTERSVYGRSSSTSASRTSRQNWLPSYE
eukprot:1257378-Pleurochrysis_carterae.AAC.1